MADAGETTAMQEGKRQPLPVGWFALFTPSDAMPKDRGLYVKRRGIVMLAALAVIAICWGLGQSAEFTEHVYARGFGQSVGRGLAIATGVLPTSIAELLVVVMLASALWMGSRAVWHVARRRRRLLNAIAAGALWWGALALVVVALFYVLWGINYFRPGLIERQGWQAYAEPPATREAQTEELSALCEQLVTAANREYVAAMGSDDIGATSFVRANLSAVDDDLERAFAAVQADLGLEESFAARRGQAKPLALSPLLDYLHIGGFYFPWTGEANYHAGLPDVMLPLTIAHEKAHQRCVSSEDEANFFGFAACVRAESAYVRYSGYLFAQRQLLGELARLDRARTAELVKQRVPGVQRDVDGLYAYWQKLQQGVAGATGRVSTQVNDAYLKVNRVEGGVESYRMSSKLLIVYYRRLNSGRE